jgi:hypothetical protein
MVIVKTSLGCCDSMQEHLVMVQIPLVDVCGNDRSKRSSRSPYRSPESRQSAVGQSFPLRAQHSRSAAQHYCPEARIEA